MKIDKNCSGYFTFFIVVAVVASLNDYWKILRLDVLFAPDRKRDSLKEESSEVPDVSMDSMEDIHHNSTQKGWIFFNINSVCIQFSIFIFEGATKFLMTFSIKRTTRTLLNFDYEDSTFSCIDGLKGLATIPLFLSLKLLTFGHLPFTNKAQLAKVIISVKLHNRSY